MKYLCCRKTKRKCPLKRNFLHEENARLELKLKEVRDDNWAKEKEWLKSTAEMQSEITALQLLVQQENNPELFNLIQGILESLQEEIVKLRENKRRDEDGSDIRSREAENFPCPATTKMSPSSTKNVNDDVLKNYRKTLAENTKLRNDIDKHRERIRKLEALLDEKNVQYQELEVKVATFQKHAEEAEAGKTHSKEPVKNELWDETERLRKDVELLRSELSCTEIENNDLRKSLNEAESENKALNAKLQAKNDSLKNDPADSTVQVALNRQDCMDELMRQLENAWSYSEQQRLTENTNEANQAELESARRNAEELEEKNKNLLEENKKLNSKLRKAKQASREKATAEKKDGKKDDTYRREPSPSIATESKRSNSTRQRQLSTPSHASTEKKVRNAYPEGAHLCVTVVEISNLCKNGKEIEEEGEVIVKLKSIKEKYKTSARDIGPTVKFGESFNFYLAQPDEDIITLHVFFRSKALSKEYHIGDCHFALMTLRKGIPRIRVAPIVQNPGEATATPAGTIEVVLQSDDFGSSRIPSAAEIEAENQEFVKRIKLYEAIAPEKLHAVDVFVATEPCQRVALLIHHVGVFPLPVFAIAITDLIESLSMIKRSGMVMLFQCRFIRCFNRIFHLNTPNEWWDEKQAFSNVSLMSCTAALESALTLKDIPRLDKNAFIVFEAVRDKKFQLEQGVVVDIIEKGRVIVVDKTIQQSTTDTEGEEDGHRTSPEPPTSSEKLNDALAAVQRACDGIRSIEEARFNEVARYNNPPPSILYTFQAVWQILDMAPFPPDWGVMKVALRKRPFLRQDDIYDEKHLQAHHRYLQLSQFTGGTLAPQSQEDFELQPKRAGRPAPSMKHVKLLHVLRSRVAAAFPNSREARDFLTAAMHLTETDSAKTETASITDREGAVDQTEKINDDTVRDTPSLYHSEEVAVLSKVLTSVRDTRMGLCGSQVKTETAPESAEFNLVNVVNMVELETTELCIAATATHAQLAQKVQELEKAMTEKLAEVPKRGEEQIRTEEITQGNSNSRLASASEFNLDEFLVDQREIRHSMALQIADLRLALEDAQQRLEDVSLLYEEELNRSKQWNNQRISAGFTRLGGGHSGCPPFLISCTTLILTPCPTENTGSKNMCDKLMTSSFLSRITYVHSHAP
eukprot:gene7281-5125_t